MIRLRKIGKAFISFPFSELVLSVMILRNFHIALKHNENEQLCSDLSYQHASEQLTMYP